MDKVKITWFKLLLAAVTLILPVLASGCAANDGSSTNLRISGSWDLYSMQTAIEDNMPKDAGFPSIAVMPSTNSINDLKNGKCDAVVMESEPTADELEGLKDYVIGYDAVCIIIDENSYDGGTYSQFGGAPLVKNGGLQNLTSDDLKAILTTNPNQSWQWNGDYYLANGGLDPGSWLAANPSVYWLKTAVSVNFNFFFPYGKYDTQTVLYQDLGLDEKAILAQRSSFLDPKLNQEDEILSWEYMGSNYFATKFGPQNYAFKLGFASRQVMTIAPQHVPVRVVSVDGINPMTDPQSIYDGTYKFSEKIHFLVRDNDTATQSLANYLLSAAGQKIIANAGYLPMVPQTGN
ncbi:MAG: substrate-binding domain-containing protein [Dehalococcoidales bacterium]